MAVFIITLVTLMIMKYFCGIVGRQEVPSIIFNQHCCQGFLSSGISDMLPAEHEPSQNVSSGFVE